MTKSGCGTAKILALNQHYVHVVVYHGMAIFAVFEVFVS